MVRNIEEGRVFVQENGQMVDIENLKLYQSGHISFVPGRNEAVIMNPYSLGHIITLKPKRRKRAYNGGTRFSHHHTCEME